MFKKPNKKGIAKQGTVVASAVGGAMVSDGIVAMIPAQFSQYGKPIVALATGILSASISGKGTGAKITQGALAGMSIKQGLDALREMVFSKMPKQDADSVLGNFTNKVLGLSSGAQNIQLPAGTFSRNHGARMPIEQKQSAPSLL